MDGISKSFKACRHAGARVARALSVLALLLALAPVAAVAAPGDENWSGQFGLAGTDNEILSSTVWNGQLVVGGYFGTAGTVAAPCVALWDGTRWQAMGAGLDNGVLSLAVWNGQLYAGGVFGNSGGTALSGLARWDGAAWQDVGGGVYGAVYALLATPDGLVVGGEFQDTAGASSVNNVALWDGSAWSVFGWGLSGGAVYGLERHDGQLAAVGAFPGHVALFNGSDWNLPGGGLPEGVNPSLALAVKSLNGLLYVGGDFDVTIEGTQLLNIAAWDGAAWQALDAGLDGAVHAFAEWDGRLAIGGMAWNPIFHLGVWDGQWFSYLAGIGGVGWGGGDYVNTLAIGGGRLYVGGALNQVGDDIYGTNVFAFDGTGYSPVGDGGALYGNVRSFGKWNGSLYAGGSFSRSSSSGSLNGIARWTGSRWESLAGGLQAGPYYELRVNGIDTIGSDLLLTGQFDHAVDGTPLHNIARWNGSAWTSPGGGFASETYRSLVYQNETWVAGGYQDLQNHATGHLWKWNGAAWQAQGGGDFGVPFAMVVWNGKLIIGGAFGSVAGVPANNVAQWNGSGWSPLGAGFNAAVVNLIVSDGQLYAAGEFWLSGSNSVPGLARWDGTQWVPVGGGLTSNWAAFALATGGGLWVGGSWDHIGSTTGLQNAARWDGAAWHPLGSGTNGPVFAMYVDGPDVWVGGMFSQAGGQMSWHVGRWTTAASGVPATDDAAHLAFRLPPPVPNPSTGEVSVSFSLPQSASGSLRIYDVRGRLVTTLAQGSLAAGRSALAWDGRASDGTAVASGVYWAVLDADGRRAATRLVRLK